MIHRSDRSGASGRQHTPSQEFLRFVKDHKSGAVGGHSLAIDEHPVVRVTWEDAAAYCNWLSPFAAA